ncbi:MAG TPA: hypothetical protein VLJ59_11540 [Mycobacteriales bacterium]|nr:hypothetical protein [Mycobacteriales bacterium]
MTDSAVATNVPATDLASFQAAQAEVRSMRVTGRPGPDTIQIIDFSDGIFTLGLQAARPGVVVPLILRILGPQELAALLDALQDQLDEPQPDPNLDLAALRAFVEVLTDKVGGGASNLFERARFADIGRDAAGAIVAHLGIGIDTVGTIHDSGCAITFSQRAIPLPPGPFRPLSQAERDSLVAALTAFLDNNPGADPLWRQLLTDLRNGV